MKFGNRFHDRAGEVVNGIKFIRPVRSKKNRVVWLMKCHCGKQFENFPSQVIHNRTTSCGCLWHTDQDGLSKTPEYICWNNMKKRCLNPTDKDFKNYGGRGIKICKRWMTFKNFLADMGKRPSATHTIERLDNDGNYCRKNCCWLLRPKQNRNRRAQKRTIKKS